MEVDRVKPFEFGGIKIFHGDCRAVLAALEPGSVQTCVTSPPYWGLRDYGIPPSVWGGEPDCEHEWGDHGIRHKGGPQGVGGQRANRDCSAQNAARRVSTGAFCVHCGAWLGNLGLEPTPDLFVAHTVEVFEAVRRVLRDDGTLWLNMGDCYANDGKWGGETGAKQSYLGDADRKRNGCEKRVTGLKPKDLIGIPWMVAFALRAADWWLRSDIIWHKPNPLPESVRDRPTKAHEYVFLLSKSQRYYYDADAIKEPATDTGGVNGRDGREECPGARPPNTRARTLKRLDYTRLGRNKRSVWSVPTKPLKEAHFATFPPKLIGPCILAGCPEGGLVLDPFAGAGTTAMVARTFGRRFVGAELNQNYIAIAEKRIGKQGTLFSAEAPP